MSLTATVDATTESTKTASNRVADAARGGAETAKSMAKDVVATATAEVERQDIKVTNAAQAKVETVNRGGAALATFWLKVMQEQTAQNIEAMRNLAVARTWEEKLAVQSSVLSGSLARMHDVFARYVELTGTMTSDVLASGAGDADKVA